MSRSMLKSKRMPNEFWDEAVACAVYLANRSPTRSVHGKTPREEWSSSESLISKSQEVLPMLMCPMRREANLMTRVRSTFSLAMAQVLKATSCTTQLPTRLSLAVMWSTMKKILGIETHKKKSTTVFLTLMKKQNKTQEENIKSPLLHHCHQPKAHMKIRHQEKA